jgi:hypothetical protein
MDIAPMSLPEDYDLRSPVIGVVDLISLDTTAGMVRLLLGDDGFFFDVNGNQWYGSKLISTSEIDFSVNGTAPAVELTLSFIQDPDAEDLVSAVKEYGVAAIKDRPARFYIQYLESTGEFFRPVFAPQLLTTRTMMNLDYSFEGPQVRRLTLTVEGPFNLRAKPVGGRYNTSDHSRRLGLPAGTINPSLEWMPNNTFDDQPLFGL